MFSVMLWPVSRKVHTEILQARQMNKARYLLSSGLLFSVLVPER
jgi:hypothetical protein